MGVGRRSPPPPSRRATVNVLRRGVAPPCNFDRMFVSWSCKSAQHHFYQIQTLNRHNF
ncbi:hypothetical protein HanHA89_Chr05g0200761 [Helianthus annuus]|nr:hypothetical protein HanHA89_Chr05g0200761 [Helianthus annuus]